MQHVQDNAEEAVRRVITALQDGACYELDNGAVIQVQVTVDRDKREATIDFTGTSEQLPNNFNARQPFPWQRCACVPHLSERCDSAQCRLPEATAHYYPAGSMLKPRYPAAVVPATSKPSQCITNTLYGAL
jgi:5-oxoprolinase (ATP-hydrolysing)